MAAALVACRPRLAPPAGPARLPEARLLVLIVVDQLGAETLARFEPGLDGGLHRLLTEGVRFDEARHRHAATLTAPGHAALASGLDPRHSGIVGNFWFDRELGEEVYAVEVGDQVTPQRLLGTTIGDWIRAADPAARSYSASRKDRAAVLLGGHDVQAALWYDAETGRFRSGPAYPEESPPWLDGFTTRVPSGRFFGRLWWPQPSTRSLATALGVREPDEGAFERDFPHAVGDATVSPDEAFYYDLTSTPFIDRQLAALARTLILEEDLGADDRLDYLGLSFSALDSIGHLYGAESLEYADALLRLDRVLGELLDFLDERVGRRHLVVAFSADHGVAPLPEVSPSGHGSRREDAADVLCAQRTLAALDRAHGEGEWFLFPGYLDRELITERALEEEAVLATAAAALQRCDAVRHVWTRTQLGAAQPPAGRAARAYWRSFHAERSPDLLAQYQPFFVPVQGTLATHGSPYPYDAHVPLILLLPDRIGRAISTPADTVDLAPTLAGLLGLPRPHHLDGVDRSATVLAASPPS